MHIHNSCIHPPTHRIICRTDRKTLSTDSFYIENIFQQLYNSFLSAPKLKLLSVFIDIRLFDFFSWRACCMWRFTSSSPWWEHDAMWSQTRPNFFLPWFPFSFSRLAEWLTTKRFASQIVNQVKPNWMDVFFVNKQERELRFNLAVLLDASPIFFFR